MTERIFSRLARGLGPLGVVGSLLLHAAVLAAVLRAPLPRDAVPPPVPRVTVALVALTPPPAEQELAPQADSPPSQPATAEPEKAPTVPEPPSIVTPSAALPPPKPRPAKPIPRSAPPVPAPVAAAPAMAPVASPEVAVAAPITAEPSPLPEPLAPVYLTAPTFRHRPAPAYPAQALRDEIEGTVRLKLLIGADGRVTEVRMLHSSGHRLLDQAALSAARAWVLEPAQKNGTPTPAWAEVDVPFRLTD